MYFNSEQIKQTNGYQKLCVMVYKVLQRISPLSEKNRVAIF